MLIIEFIRISTALSIIFTSFITNSILSRSFLFTFNFTINFVRIRQTFQPSISFRVRFYNPLPLHFLLHRFLLLFLLNFQRFKPLPAPMLLQMGTS